MAVESKRDRRFLAIGYAIGLILVTLPLLELVLTVWPPRFGVIGWRWASVSLFSQALIQPMVGLSLIAVTAWGLSHQRILKLLAVVYGLGVLFLASTALLYALDALEIRAIAQDVTQLNAEVTGVRVFLTFGLYTMLLAWLSFTTFGAVERGEEKSGSKSVGGEMLVAGGDKKE